MYTLVEYRKAGNLKLRLHSKKKETKGQTMLQVGMSMSHRYESLVDIYEIDVYRRMLIILLINL